MIAPSMHAGTTSPDGDRVPRRAFSILLAELFAGRLDLWRSLVLLVEPLDRHDRLHHTEFLRTLETFFETGLSTGATAERLGIHRHTVAYRLKQIERILGRPVRIGEDRLAVELAIRARKLRL